VLAISALVLACQKGSAPAALEDTPENRAAQADRYFAAMPPENLVNDMVANMSSRMPEDRRGAFVELMTKHLDLAKVRSIMRDGMTKHFTADELSALADFYGSPLGKSATAKFGTYMTETMPAIQKEIIAALGKMQSQEEAPTQAPAPSESPAPEPPKQP
jgi:hypothetical protein